MKNEYLLLENIALFLKQGYLIQDILAICKASLNNPQLDEIEEALHAGISLDEAILACKFNATFKEYFKFFRLKNNISDAIMQSISICKENTKVVKKLQKELMYPAFLIVFLVFFSIFVMYILLPQVQSMFSSFSIEQSWFFKVFLKVFTFLPIIMFGIAVLVIMASIACIYSVKKQRFEYIDILVEHVPVFSSLIKKYYSIKFAIYYNELLKDGYDSTTIIQLLNKQIVDSDIKMIVYEIQQDLLVGKSLATIIEDFEYFENMFVQYFSILMQDNYPTKSLNEYLEITVKTLHYNIERFIKIFVPIIYGFVAGFVIMIYLAVILPMMDIVNLM